MDQQPTSILVVAHQTAATPALLDAVRERARSGPATFHLLVPRRRRTGERANNPQEVGGQEAREVLRDALLRLTQTAGSEVTGETGGTDPLEAIRDALNHSRYDEIIISSLPLGISRWLRHDLVSKVQPLGLPVQHVVGNDSRVAASASR